MDGGIVAILTGIVGVAGTLGGALVGRRGAVKVASATSDSNHELARQAARRQAYVALGTAAFRFGRKVVDIQQIMDKRWAGSRPTHVAVPTEEYAALDACLDEVAHTAINVQLHGPVELFDMAWDVYTACQHVERALAKYGVVSKSSLEEVKGALETAMNEASRARGIFLSNGRAHLEGKSVPLQAKPTHEPQNAIGTKAKALPRSRSAHE
ncbi:hypothetical protein [Streptosporangium sp. H16]|uniref:hypothetical protein n=1 Tax=Streptosporangium sp. H16 TaxID=3444184 RepID=UPI003F7B0809